MNFVFHYSYRAYTATANDLATAKRMALKSLNPPRPGKWIGRATGALFVTSAVPHFEWKRLDQCRHTRITSILNMERCQNAATRDGFCTRHANERV